MTTPLLWSTLKDIITWECFIKMKNIDYISIVLSNLLLLIRNDNNVLSLWNLLLKTIGRDRHECFQSSLIDGLVAQAGLIGYSVMTEHPWPTARVYLRGIDLYFIQLYLKISAYLSQHLQHPHLFHFLDSKMSSGFYCCDVAPWSNGWGFLLQLGCTWHQLRLLSIWRP